MHLDLKHVEALAAVLGTGSFEAAAKQLNLSASALSQRVRLLEDRIGAVLLTRDTPCAPTDAGRLVWQYAQEIILREQALVASLALDAGKARAPVAIAISPDTMATWLLDALKDVPDRLFVLKVDNYAQGTRLLARGEVLAAVTFGQRQVQGCDAFILGALQYIPVCSPAFFTRWFSQGLTADALKAAPCLTYNPDDRLQIDFAEQSTGQKLVPPTHYMPDARGLADAAALGFGWVMLPHLLAQPLIAEGRLTCISEDNHIFSELTWQVTRASRSIMQPLTRAVRKSARNLLVQEY